MNEGFALITEKNIILNERKHNVFKLYFVACPLIVPFKNTNDLINMMVVLKEKQKD